MDTIGSLSSDLPKRPAIDQEIAELDAKTVSEFKTAATAVTKLYTLSSAKSKLLRTQGYLNCLEDLVKYITTSDLATTPTASAVSSTISIENVLNWALNKQHHLNSNPSDQSPQSQNNSTPHNRVASTSSQESSLPNRSISSTSTVPESPTTPVTQDQQQQQQRPPSLRAYMASKASTTQFSFTPPPLAPTPYIDYDSRSNTIFSRDQKEIKEQVQSNRPESNNGPDFSKDSDSGESDSDVLEDIDDNDDNDTIRGYRRDTHRRTPKMGSFINSTKMSKKASKNHRSTFLNTQAGTHHNEIDSQGYRADETMRMRGVGANSLKRNLYMAAPSQWHNTNDDEANSPKESQVQMNTTNEGKDSESVIPMSAFYYDGSAPAEPKRQRFV